MHKLNVLLEPWQTGTDVVLARSGLPDLSYTTKLSSESVIVTATSNSFTSLVTFGKLLTGTNLAKYITTEANSVESL
jgi:hypothetical protein